MPHRPKLPGCKSFFAVLNLCLDLFRTALFLSAWVLAFGCTSVWAQDHILNKAYWTDTTGMANFEQAVTATYTPYPRILSQGFTASAQWVKLNIAARAPGEPDSLVLRIRPVFLDLIALYDPSAPESSAQARVTGDTVPWVGNEFDSLHYTFVIPALNQPRHVFLRIQSTSVHSMHVDALIPKDMHKQEHGLWFTYSLLMAILFSFWLWIFISWLHDRDPVNGFFALRQILVLIYTACFLGYPRLLLDNLVSPAFLDKFSSLTVVLMTGISIAFEFRFLSEYVLPRWARRYFWTVLMLMVLSFLMVCFDITMAGLRLNMTMMGIVGVSFFVISLQVKFPAAHQQAREQYLLPMGWVRSYYAGVLIILSIYFLASSGFFEGHLLTIYGILFYGILTGLFMTTLLIFRTRKMEQFRYEITNNLNISREQLALETLVRIDQTQLLNMLMHELKTPLSVIDLAQQASTDLEAKDYVARNVAIIKSILDRCLNADRIALGQLDVDLQPIQLRPLLEQLIGDHPAGRLSLQWDLPTPALNVHTDYQYLQIVLNNLLDNAVRYGDEMQPVGVIVQAQTSAAGKQGVTITVSNKPGMASWPDPDKVFIKYYRSAGAKMLSGTGLGLFLVASIARIMGATCLYAPDDTHVRFELWLPI